MMFRPVLCFAVTLLVALSARAEDLGKDATIHRDLIYRSQFPDKCQLDLYVPVKKNFATIVWFHGGGLTGGNRELPPDLLGQGFAVVGAGYRLAPDVSVRQCIEDAASCVAWVFNNIEKYGGDPDRIYVSGHSAGGYLTSMVGLDRSYLDEFEVDADRIAGLAPLSGQTITHFTHRKSMGLEDTDVRVDEMAPLAFIRKDAPPILIVTGDREQEMLGRYEENAYFVRMLKVVGHPNVTLFELDGFDHSGMAKHAMPLLVEWVQKIENSRRQSD
jgi:acetyl esterase/lipase